jgi:hypothetical protein
VVPPARCPTLNVRHAARCAGTRVPHPFAPLRGGRHLRASRYFGAGHTIRTHTRVLAVAMFGLRVRISPTLNHKIGMPDSGTGFPGHFVCPALSENQTEKLSPG